MSFVKASLARVGVSSAGASSPGVVHWLARLRPATLLALAVFAGVSVPGDRWRRAAGLAATVPPAVGALPRRQDTWQRLDGSLATARYYRSSPRDSLRAARALRTLEAMGPLPGLRRQGAGAGQGAGGGGEGDLATPLVTIAPNRSVLDSLAGGATPEWAGAVAVPARGEVILPGGRDWPASLREEARVLRHEWAHLALAREVEGLRIPRWFNEGYAEWSAGGWREDGELRLGLALALGRTPALDSLAIAWPRDRVPAEVAYLLSASIIEYLVRSSGVGGLEAFLAEWRRARSFDRALRSVYGATPAQLETDWRRWVKRRYGWLAVLSHSAVFWVALLAGLSAMFLRRRRHRREEMARLRATEPPDDPDYWSAGSA